MLYKVVAEEGVVVNDLEFVKDELFELEADSFNSAELLEDGSIVEEVGEEEVAAVRSEDAVEEVLVDSTPALTYKGQKVVGEVREVANVDGVVHKEFAVESGETYKLTPEEFEVEVL